MSIIQQDAKDVLRKYWGPTVDYEHIIYFPQYGAYYLYKYAMDAQWPGSPIVLDLDRDGVETTSLTDGAYLDGAYFDHDKNGFAEKTGWVAADDGLLVWDKNDDGVINDGSEVFGTTMPDGSPAENGFQVLSSLDSNSNGKIDSTDTIWSQLKVWQDFNGDGYSDAGELFTLGELGIQAINTSYTTSDFVDANGNEHRQVGSFTWTDNTTGAAADVWFKADKTYTIANEWLEVSGTIAALPDLQAYGNVYDLQQAMVNRLLKNAPMLRFPYHSALRRTSKVRLTSRDCGSLASEHF